MDSHRLTDRMPGFTLLELLVAIALTSLTMLLGYGVLRFVEGTLQQSRAQEAQSWESQLLWKSLEEDMRFVDSLSYGQDHIGLFRDQDTISIYAHEGEAMIRKTHNRLDTFYVRGRWLAGNSSFGWNDSLLLDTLWIQSWPEASAQPDRP